MIKFLQSTITACLIALALTSQVQASDNKALVFEDDFNDRTELGSHYTTALADSKAWTIVDGVQIT